MTAFIKNKEVDIIKENTGTQFCKACMNRKIRLTQNKFKDQRSRDSWLTQIRFVMFINLS